MDLFEIAISRVNKMRGHIMSEMSNEDWSAAQAEQANPDNWRFGIYRSPRDPHVWVRKQRAEFGWTLNFAHRSSWLWVIAAISVLVGFSLLGWFFR